MEKMSKFAALLVLLAMMIPCIVGEVEEQHLEEQRWGFLTDPNSWTVLASSAPSPAPASSHAKAKAKAKPTSAISPSPSPLMSLSASTPSLSPASPPAENAAIGSSAVDFLNLVVGLAIYFSGFFIF